MHLFRSVFKGKHKQVTSSSNREFASPLAKRLAEEFALLQEIAFARNFRADPSYGRAMEDRIISRELFDLELQEVDEQIRYGSPE